MYRGPATSVDREDLPVLHVIGRATERCDSLIGACAQGHQVKATRPERWIGHVLAGHGADAAAARNVATQLAAARHLPLVLAGADGRRSRSDVTELTHLGIQASSGPPPDGALLVTGEEGAEAVVAGAHLTVRAGSSENLEARPEIATPVPVVGSGALEPGRQP